MDFTRTRLASFFDVKADLLRQWQKRGLIPKPSIKTSEKPGEPNLYSLDDICRIGVFIHLVRWCYMAPMEAKNLVRSIRWDQLDERPVLYITTKSLGSVVGNQIGSIKPKEGEPGVLSVVELRVKDLVETIREKAQATE